MISTNVCVVKRDWTYRIGISAEGIVGSDVEECQFSAPFL